MSLCFFLFFVVCPLCVYSLGEIRWISGLPPPQLSSSVRLFHFLISDCYLVSNYRSLSSCLFDPLLPVLTLIPGLALIKTSLHASCFLYREFGDSASCNIPFAVLTDLWDFLLRCRPVIVHFQRKSKGQVKISEICECNLLANLLNM